MYLKVEFESLLQTETSLKFCRLNK